MTSITIAETWATFENWLSQHWPDGLNDLNPPATDDDISKLEQALDVKLPADFIACLKIHNGQAGMAGGFFHNCEFLSGTAIVDQWAVWKDLFDSGEFDGITSEPDSGVRNDWWNPKWIPVTHNGGGDHFCLDMAPAPKGREGQIITMWHDMGERSLEAPGFAQWFRDYVDAALDGKLVYSEDYDGLIDVDLA